MCTLTRVGPRMGRTLEAPVRFFLNSRQKFCSNINNNNNEEINNEGASPTAPRCAHIAIFKHARWSAGLCFWGAGGGMCVSPPPARACGDPRAPPGGGARHGATPPRGVGTSGQRRGQRTAVMQHRVIYAPYHIYIYIKDRYIVCYAVIRDAVLYYRTLHDAMRCDSTGPEAGPPPGRCPRAGGTHPPDRPAPRRR